MFLPASSLHTLKPLDAVATPVAVWKLSKSGFILVNANSLYRLVSHVDPAEVFNKKITSILPIDITSQVESSLTRCLKAGVPEEDELAITCDGETRWWRFLYSPWLGEDGEVLGLFNTCIDITDKVHGEQALATSMKRYEEVINSAHDGVIAINKQQKITMFNRAARDLFGLDVDDVDGLGLEDLIPERFRPQHQGHVTGFSKSSVASRPMQTRATVMGRRKDGGEFPLEITISKIKVGEEIEMTAVLRDVSARLELIEELQEAASIDPLTGAFNRRYFSQQLEVESKRCRRFDHKMAVVMFDLDRFKSFNDSRGHSYGDSILKSVVDQIGSKMREVDVLSRWGGDEFIALLPEIDLEDAYAWGERIRVHVEETQAEKFQSGVTLSIGIVISDGEETLEDLLSRVDGLLYQAKAAGRNKVVGQDSV